MSAGGVLLGEVVGFFPLMDVVVRFGVVHAAVVVEDALSNLQVSESDSSTEAAQVVDGGVVPGEEVEDLIGVGVLDVEDFLFADTGIVGTIADRSRVVIRILSCPEHDMLNKII